MLTNDMYGKIMSSNCFLQITPCEEKTKLPEKYIINKGATILFWKDGTKTIVKRSKGDEYNKILGFLWAYFQKTSGLSKTKANKYLSELEDEDEYISIEYKEENDNFDNLTFPLFEKGTMYKGMKLDFKNYDSDLLKHLSFEIRLNNHKIAEFDNIDDLSEYIEMIPKFKYKKNKWFIVSFAKIVFNFVEESEEE